MMKPVMSVIAATLLSGCIAAPAAIVFDGSRRETTKQTVKILAETRPELPPEAAGCVVNAMTRRELIAFGTSDISQITTKHRAAVETAIVRPGAVDCLAAL